MQDRYAGDVGDFVKLGLLRHLSVPDDVGGPGLAVGLNWYLAPDETHNADGKHVAYLRPTNSHHASLAACDAELMACLQRVVRCERSVSAIGVSGALPPEAAVHSERLDPTLGFPGRLAWHERALASLASCDVVLVDPDNGIRQRAARGRIHKYALLSELADYASRG
jgi:hypothetical protein